MKTALIAGIVLLAIGICSLAYQGITYTTQKKVIDLGPIQASKSEEHTIPLPPILGALAIAGGIALIFTSRRGA